MHARRKFVNQTTFDIIARHAGNAVSRRGSLRLLGGATLTGAIAAAGTAGAKKGPQQNQERCRKQGQECREFFAEFCAGTVDPENCKELVLPCCKHFARCQTGKGLACIILKSQA
jgi:hypothetical protein